MRSRDLRLTDAARPLLAAATSVLAWRTLSELVARVGHAGVTLDDAYIHFQYARAIAEGHPLRYQAGEPISTGATSVLWPLLLAPFYAAGFRDVSLAWITWLFSFAALGMLAWDAAMLVRAFAGRTASIVSALLVLTFGGHVWCAASGMEVVPFACAIVHALRRACEWVEGKRDKRALTWLLVASNAAPLLRPEGLVFSIAVAVMLVVAGTEIAPKPRPSMASRALGLSAVASPLVVTLALRAATGSTLSNTAVAKLLFFNPYLSGPSLRAAIFDNVRVFVGTLLEGEIWSAEFVPSGGAFVAIVAVVATFGLAWARGYRARAVAIALLALAMMIPCFYTTFLWNRLRYLWPFATGWLVSLACLAHLFSLGARRVGVRSVALEPVLGGIFIGLFAAKMPGVIDDVAQSASGIDRQQVAAGRWVKANLPATARVGINDAGAIAYFGDRKTFDIVGLTTTGEAQYWLAGAASRLEHYEKLDPARLPTHFAVYPEWMGTDVMFGKGLAEFTVNDSTILGGRVKRVSEADWSWLGSGEVPFTENVGAIVDAVDVADMDSERAHRYALAGAREGDQTILSTVLPSGKRIVDGGRVERRADRFVVKLTPGVRHMAWVRLETFEVAHLTLRAGGMQREVDVQPGEPQEVSFEIEASAADAKTEIALDSNAPISIFHYWFAVPR